MKISYIKILKSFFKKNSKAKIHPNLKKKHQINYIHDPSR
jgi:hypothetical protein